MSEAQKTTETFVFLGSYSEVPDARIKLTRFGQRVELPPELADGTNEDGGLLCIPAADFDPLLAEFGIDQKSLNKWGPAASHANAPAEFKALVASSRQRLHDRREPAREAIRKAQAEAAAAALAAQQPNESEEAI